MRILVIGIVSICFALGTASMGQARAGNWFLDVKQGPNQEPKLQLQSEELFVIELQYRLSAWTKPFYSFTTRPKKINIHLLTEWDGVSFDRILGGEIIGELRAPGLTTGSIWATVDSTLTLRSSNLTAPFLPGDYFVSGCLSRATGGGKMGSVLGASAAARCSAPVKLEVSQRPRPDLVISKVQVKSAVKRIGGSGGIQLGDRITLSAETLNAGNARSQFPSRVQFFLILPSANRSFVDPDNDLMLDDVRLPRLDAGEAKLQTITIDGPPNPGDYRFGVCVNPITIAQDGELDVDNNCSHLVTARVQRPSTPCVDLTVESVSGLETTRAPLERYDLSFVVKNVGNRDMTAPGVAKIQRPGRVNQDSDPTGLIAVGETETFSFVGVAPETLGISVGKVCAHTKQDCNPRNDCLDIAMEVQENP